MPPFDELSAWIYTLARLREWETARVSLCKSALSSGEDPGNAYRRIRQLCGVNWSEARAVGFDYILVKFVQRCRMQDARIQRKLGQERECGAA